MEIHCRRMSSNCDCFLLATSPWSRNLWPQRGGCRSLRRLGGSSIVSRWYFRRQTADFIVDGFFADTGLSSPTGHVSRIQVWHWLLQSTSRRLGRHCHRKHISFPTSKPIHRPESIRPGFPHQTSPASRPALPLLLHPYRHCWQIFPPFHPCSFDQWCSPRLSFSLLFRVVFQCVTGCLNGFSLFDISGMNHCVLIENIGFCFVFSRF